MNLVEHVNMITPTRQARLRGFMATYGVTLSSLASKMDLTIQGVARIIRSDHAPPHRVEQLLALGFPQDLLPSPVIKKTGPKAKDRTE